MKLEWHRHISKAKKDFGDLIFNSYSVLREIDYTRDEVEEMPLLELFETLNMYSPKIKTLMEQKYGKEMEAQMTGQKTPDEERRQRMKHK